MMHVMIMLHVGCWVKFRLLSKTVESVTGYLVPYISPEG